MQQACVVTRNRQLSDEQNEESALHNDNQTEVNKKREFIKEQGVACDCCRQIKGGQTSRWAKLETRNSSRT